MKKKPAPLQKGPRFVVRRSGIHGRGVFAHRTIFKNDVVVEYKGEIISERVAERRYPEDYDGINHTFLFGVSTDHNIDGGSKGNSARWINHSCSPNCDTFEENDRIFVRAFRTIKPGEELTYDYAIEAGERLTRSVKARWPCWCGTRRCRGTVLLPTRKPRGKR